MRPLTVALARRSSSFWRHAASEHSGNTVELAMNAWPSGVQVKASTPVGRDEAFAASPPARGTVQIWGEPSRSERNASVFPSGEKRGAESRFSPELTCFDGPPSAGTIQTAERNAFAATSGVAMA